MKYLIILLFATLGYSQEYHLDNNNPNALRLYKTKTALQASINVFMVNAKSQTNTNGLWYIGKKTTTSQPIRFVNYIEQAQIVFYEVHYKEQAGHKKRG